MLGNAFDGLIIGIIIAGIAFIISAMRKGSSVMESKPSRLESFEIKKAPQEALKAVIQSAQQAGYKVSAMDENRGRVVFEEGASATSVGFFFPIFISQSTNNSSLIEVGIKSKLFQVGPIVSRSHEKFLSGIKAYLFSGNEV